MRYGIYFTFDTETEEQLQNLQRKLTREVADIPSIERKMDPHLMMLVFDDEDPARVQNKFVQLAAGISRFNLKLDAINAFRGRRNVLYAEPQLSDELKNSYLCALHAFSGSAIVPAYCNPVEWKPHVTLTKGLPNDTFRAAKVLAERNWFPLEGHVKTIALINVQRPLDVLASKNLENGSLFAAPEEQWQLVSRLANKGERTATGLWNVIVTINSEGYREAIRILKDFGHVARTDFFNVLTLKVPDTAIFLERFLDLVMRQPGVLNFISHATPVEEVFYFHTAREFEDKLRDLGLQWASHLTGKSFHIRVHRRGHKAEIPSQKEERFLAEWLIEILEKNGTPGHIRFEDPDAIVIIETIGNEAGLSLWTREQIKRYPFLNLDLKRNV